MNERLKLACRIYDHFKRYDKKLRGDVVHHFDWRGRRYSSTKYETMGMILALWVVLPDQLGSELVKANSLKEGEA